MNNSNNHKVEKKTMRASKTSASLILVCVFCSLKFVSGDLMDKHHSRNIRGGDQDIYKLLNLKRRFLTLDEEEEEDLDVDPQDESLSSLSSVVDEIVPDMETNLDLFLEKSYPVPAPSQMIRRLPGANTPAPNSTPAPNPGQGGGTPAPNPGQGGGTPAPNPGQGKPSNSPSATPSRTPSASPSRMPSKTPSATPSRTPSATPSQVPSKTPSATPSRTPSASPSQVPSKVPSAMPSQTPSASPSQVPSKTPSQTPSASPSQVPSKTPSAMPSRIPSGSPSQVPSKMPSVTPSVTPSRTPSATPSAKPSAMPLPILTSIDPTCKNTHPDCENHIISHVSFSLVGSMYETANNNLEIAEFYARYEDATEKLCIRVLFKDGYTPNGGESVKFNLNPSPAEVVTAPHTITQNGRPGWEGCFKAKTNNGNTSKNNKNTNTNKLVGCVGISVTSNFCQVSANGILQSCVGGRSVSNVRGNSNIAFTDSYFGGQCLA